MKYEVIESFCTFLAARRRPATVRVYSERLSSLLEGHSVLDTLEKLDIDKMINNINKAKNKNEFSQFKNALLYFLEFEEIALNEEQLNKINDLEKKQKKKYRKLKEVDFQKVNRTIQHIRNKKLKLSYQTIVATGLRVSELAQIKKSDCNLSGDAVIFQFIGKGGNQEQVIFEKKDNAKLFDELRELIEDTSDNKKIFYSANYLQQKAKTYNFRCHDLRRACAKLEYEKTRSKDKVQQKLRHSSKKTTDIYLKSKVNIK